MAVPPCVGSMGLILFLFSMLWQPVCGATPDMPWPLPAQNTRLTCFCPDSGLHAFNNRSKPASVFDVAFEIKSLWPVGAVVGANQTVFLHHRRPVLHPGDSATVEDEYVSAISIPSARILWTTRLSPGTGLIPGNYGHLGITAVGRLIVCIGEPSPPAVVGIDTKTGAILWTTPTATDPFFPHASAALPNLVFVHLQQRDSPLQESLLALDERDGSVRWQRTPPGGFWLPSVIEDADVAHRRRQDLRAFLLGRETITVLNATSGQALASWPVGSPEEKSRSVIAMDAKEGGLYYGLRKDSHDYIRKLRSDGSIVWTTELVPGKGTLVDLMLDEAHGRVVVVRSSRIYSVDAADGTIKWTTGHVGYFRGLMDELGNYYILDNLILRWDTGVLQELRGDGPWRSSMLLTLGAGHLILSDGSELIAAWPSRDGATDGRPRF